MYSILIEWIFYEALNKEKPEPLSRARDFSTVLLARADDQCFSFQFWFGSRR